MNRSLQARVVIAAAALAALAALAGAVSAQATPTALKDIPVFPNAKPVISDTSESETSDLGAGGPPLFTPSSTPARIRSRYVMSYEVAAHPEAMFAFYAVRIGGLDSINLDQLMNPWRLAPGTASQVFRLPNFYQASPKLRAVFTNRPPHSPDNWIRVAGFLWTTKELNSDVTSFGIGIRDDGLAKDSSSYRPRTRLVIIRTTYVGLDAVAGADPPKAEPKPAIVVDPPPTRAPAPIVTPGAPVAPVATASAETAFGLAIYPGARFDAPYSTRMSRGGITYQIYLSDDEPVDVARFYQSRLGVTPSEIGAGERAFLVEGRMPMPGLAVFVSRNTVPSRPGKTIITLRKGTERRVR